MTENQSKNTIIKNINSFIDSDRNTHLHYYAASGNIEKVTKEIEDEHIIDPVNYLGWTPLMMATRHGHLEVIQLLLEKRADSTRKNKFGFDVFSMAIASGNLEVVNFILQHLLRGGVSRQSMQTLFAPISLAVLFDNVGVLQYLIENRFCINTGSSVGITPLGFAAAIGNPEIINLLMAKGARATSRTSPKGQSATNVPHAQQTGKPPLLNLPPLVLVKPPPFSPQPTFLNISPNVQMPRRCSDMTSPCFSANISPLPGGFVQQVFFPQNFSPSHFASPGPIFANNNNNEFLNVALMQISPFYSPVPVNVPYHNVM